MNLAEKLEDLSNKAALQIKQENVKIINDLVDDFYEIILEKIYNEANKGNKWFRFRGCDLWINESNSLPQIKFTTIIKDKTHREAWSLVKDVLTAIAHKLSKQGLHSNVKNNESNEANLMISWSGCNDEKIDEKEKIVKESNWQVILGTSLAIIIGCVIWHFLTR